MCFFLMYVYYRCLFCIFNKVTLFLLQWLSLPVFVVIRLIITAYKLCMAYLQHPQVRSEAVHLFNQLVVHHTKHLLCVCNNALLHCPL